jgi:outer membrane receptor for ferrienterochelin and colicins
MKIINIYLTVLFFLVSIVLFAGNKMQIKVTDAETSNPVSYVKVTTLCRSNNCKDTIFQDLTNKQGIAETIFDYPFIVKINHIGYKPYTETILNDSGLKIQLERKSYTLDEVVTTGQFSPSSTQKSVYQITSVPAEKIQAQNAFNLRELMSNEMNIKLSQDNILGSSMSINGLSEQNVKIMIDGVPVIGRLDGNIDLSQINLNNAERVEIIEGPMSVMYGTDALGGVVNIITKDNFDGKVHINGNSYYESVGTYNFDGSLGYNFGKNNILISGGRNFFNGFSKVDTSRSKEWKPKEQYFTDWQFNNFMDKMTFRYNGKYFYDYILNRGAPYDSYREKAYDDTYKTYRLDNTLSLKGELAKDRFFDIQTNYSYYERRKNTFNKNLVTLQQNLVTTDTSAQDTSIFDNWMVRGTYSHDNAFNLFSYQIGFDLNYTSIRGKKILELYRDMGDYAVFGSFQYKPVDEIIIQPGIRFLRNTNYEAPVIPSLNIKADINDFITLRASYAKGFRAPSLQDLYFLFVDINHNIHGNPNLKAETSDSYNLGFNFHFTSDKYAFNIEPSFFYNDVLNLITLVNINTSTNEYSFVNIGHNRSMGTNLSLSYLRADMSSKIGVTWIGQSYLTDNQGKLLDPVFNPEATANIIYNSTIFELKLGLFYKYTGKQIAFQQISSSKNEQYTIDDYHTLDFSLSRNFFDEMINFSLGVKNIFDVVNINRSVAASATHSDGNLSNPVSYGRTFTASLRFNIK